MTERLRNIVYGVAIAVLFFALGTAAASAIEVGDRVRVTSKGPSYGMEGTVTATNRFALGGACPRATAPCYDRVSFGSRSVMFYRARGVQRQLEVVDSITPTEANCPGITRALRTVDMICRGEGDCARRRERAIALHCG